MKSAVIVFPGSNCDRDMQVALRQSTGREPYMVWHRDSEMPDVDLITIPGGFSYGDYLRCGSMASHSPIMRTVSEMVKKGVHVLGVCNGFQILTEVGLLPGVLMRNTNLKYICKDVFLKVEANDSPFMRNYRKNQVISIPIAHHDGNYFTDDETLEHVEGDGLVAFRYCERNGKVSTEANPNGSRANIAAIFNQRRTVLGMMPHPERLADAQLGGSDGKPMFDGLMDALG